MGSGTHETLFPCVPGTHGNTWEHMKYMKNKGQWITYLYFDVQMVRKFGNFWQISLDNERIDGLYSYYLQHGELPLKAMSDHKRWYRETYQKSERWDKLRAMCRVRAHDFCQSAGCENLGQVAHHTSYDNLDADFDAELNDLQWLCFGCHSRIHNVTK